MNNNNLTKISLKETRSTGKVLPTAIVVGGIILTCIAGNAFGLDLDKAAKAATEPLLKFTHDHWGKFVTLAGVVTAIVGEGDMRTRAIRAGIGVGAASAVVLGVMASIT